MLPTYPITDLNSSSSFTSWVKKLLINTNTMSLIQTPATKLNPPLWPLLILCFKTVKMTGPTDNARINPNPTPLMMASVNSVFFSDGLN
jgi:hypothetical protein